MGWARRRCSRIRRRTGTAPRRLQPPLLAADRTIARLAAARRAAFGHAPSERGRPARLSLDERSGLRRRSDRRRALPLPRPRVLPRGRTARACDRGGARWRRRARAQRLPRRPGGIRLWLGCEHPVPRERRPERGEGAARGLLRRRDGASRRLPLAHPGARRPEAHDQVPPAAEGARRGGAGVPRPCRGRRAGDPAAAGDLPLERAHLAGAAGARARRSRRRVPPPRPRRDGLRRSAADTDSGPDPVGAAGTGPSTAAP